MTIAGDISPKQHGFPQFRSAQVGAVRGQGSPRVKASPRVRAHAQGKLVLGAQLSDGRGSTPRPVGLQGNLQHAGAGGRHGYRTPEQHREQLLSAMGEAA